MSGPVQKISKNSFKAYRGEVFFIVSLKTEFENLNLVKSYNKPNSTVVVFSL